MLPVHGLYGHTQRNSVTSLCLFASFAVLLMLIQALIGLAYSAASVSMCSRLAGHTADCLGSSDYIIAVFDHFARTTQLFETGWIYALSVGAGWVLLNAWWHGVIVRYETGARCVERRDAPSLYAIVEVLAITAGLRCPQIEIIETDKLNAFASGFSSSRATIGVTRGLIQTLPRRELEAVIAHEIAHIKLGDIRLLAIAKACSELSFVFAKVTLEAAAQPMRAALLMCIFVLAFGPFATGLLLVGLLSLGGSSLLFRSMISRRRELVADAAAIDLTRDAVALASALRRVAANDDLPKASPVTRAMMFSSSIRSLGMTTHPAVEDRIAAIMRHAFVTEADIAEQQMAACAALPIRVGTPATRKSRAAEARQRRDWIERWVLSGRADQIAKKAMKIGLLVPVVIAVLMVLPGLLLYLIVPR